MLHANIQAIRKSKGLSQEELANKLHVVRQTISKWEQGLSVPDADLLISLAQALETPVTALLGENVVEAKADAVQELAEKLERINLQLAQRKVVRRKVLHGALIILCVVNLALFAFILTRHSPYLGWEDVSLETAVMGVVLHAFEWLYVRCAPLLLIGGMVGVFFTRKR